MEENYTFDGYLGSGYQQKFLWQLLTESEFAENIFPFLNIKYWDDETYKRYFLILKDYYNEYGKVPNLQNKSIYQAISKYKRPNDTLDEETLLSVTNSIKMWNDRVLNKQLDYDGDAVQKSAFSFITQGEYVDMATYILSQVKVGQYNDKTLNVIEDKIKNIHEIGSEEDDGSEVFEDIDDTLLKDFREPIPTGIKELDELMGGGLGKGEMGILLAPSGVGKTTYLTFAANFAYGLGKNVLQIIFEDTIKPVKRKHYAIWSGYKLSEIDENREVVRELVNDAETILTEKGGKLIIKKFSQEDTTMPKIRKWIDRYRKKTGIKFDIIFLDYLDCLEAHKASVDQNAVELSIVKAFEAMAGEYNIPCWTALQTNRSGFGAEFVSHENMGGSIKRAQKTHFLMSVSKGEGHKESGMANLQILKSRFGQDGQKFEDVIFNNDKVAISIGGACQMNTDKFIAGSADKLNQQVSYVNDGEINSMEEATSNEKQTDFSVDYEMSRINNGMDVTDAAKDLLTQKLNVIAEKQDIMIDNKK